jgi:ribosomal protein S25
MTEEETRQLVDWIQKEIAADSKISKSINDPHSTGRAAGLNNVLRKLEEMGVIESDK